MKIKGKERNIIYGLQSQTHLKRINLAQESSTW